MLSFRRAARGGFTLTEIMIVLVVLGLLMAVALPRVSQVLFTGKVSASKTSLGSISKACKNFNADTSCWPGSIADLMQPVVVGSKCFHPKTLAPITYSAVHAKNWKGPYVDGTTAEVAVDAWGSGISIGLVGGGDYAGRKMGSTADDVAAKAADAATFQELGNVDGLYLHSTGDDTVTGTGDPAKDDLYVFVSSKTQ